MKRKKTIKIILLLCYIAIPMFLYMFVLIRGIKTEILLKGKGNSYAAYIEIIPAICLFISNFAYFLVKHKYFVWINMVLGLFTLGLGEFLTCYHYNSSISPRDIRFLVIFFIIIELWIFLHSVLFKKIFLTECIETHQRDMK